MKRVLLLGLILICAGMLTFGIATVACRADFAQLWMDDSTTVTQDVEEDFSNISVITEGSDIVFVYSEDGTCRVVSNETEKLKHRVTVTDGTLLVEDVDEREWYDYFLNFASTSVTVYLPKVDYSSVNIDCSSADVEIGAGFSFGELIVDGSTADVSLRSSSFAALDIELTTGDVSLSELTVGGVQITVTTGDVDFESVESSGDIFVGVSTGEVKIKDTVCKSLTTTGGTGDLRLVRTEVEEVFFAKRSTGEVTVESGICGRIEITVSTGDVTLNASDAEYIEITATTADVSGSLLTPKKIVVKTGTGSVRVPNEDSENICKITTGTGDVLFS